MSAGRPRAFDTERALQAATNVFWQLGYEASSLQTLLRQTGLSKSSFYQAFGSKQGLFARCLDDYTRSSAGELKWRLAEAASARDFLEQTFLGVAATAGDPQGQRGCLLLNAASEFGQLDPAVSRLVDQGMKRMLGVFRAAVERAQAEGSVDPAEDPEALADYLVAGMSGLRTLIKSGVDRARAQTLARHLLRNLA
ncbi:TetR/AcrR family transcriptional regulator [Alkalilimnicola sp. S0819]|uniref:TetR/AcrR family transcriptional regulator n=1 Tax=Alkalilimnicola sp. S0819 TaxID=2613922 RepID=UPI00186A5569|nr:TetR/AcrR family transcriptional regulator [Alkalilimnicola sp. S0819]